MLFRVGMDPALTFLRVFNEFGLMLISDFGLARFGVSEDWFGFLGQFLF